MPDVLAPARLGVPCAADRPRWSLAPGVRLALVLVAALLSVAAILGGNWQQARWSPHPDELSPGPLLESALARGKLLVGVREYVRPVLPGAPTVAEPDSRDAALAQALGDYLQLPVELVGLPSGLHETALAEGRIDLLIAGNALQPSPATDVALPASVRHSEGVLLVLRGMALADKAPLRGNTVCLAEGSPYHSIIAEQGAVARSHPSSVHAIAAFMAGECTALAEEESLVAWLLQQSDWRFYRRLPIVLRPEDAGHVRLPVDEPQTRAWLAAALADWQLRGAQDSALAHWIGELSVDVLKLEQGLMCH